MLRKFYVILIICLFLLPVYAYSELIVEDEIDITEFVVEEEETISEKRDSDGAYIMTITCTGDFTIGKDSHHKDIFSTELKKHGNDINFIFQNIRNLLADDDLTIINFEGTLTNSSYIPPSKTKDDFVFSIDPAFVSVLPDNSIEAVSLENNHVMDHGEEGYNDTKEALRNAGVIYSNSEEIGIYEYKNTLQIAMLSYLCIDRYGKPFKGYNTFEEAVCADIQKAKEYYPLVIVSFHWGIEKEYKPTKNQIRLGRMAVDAGADLVIGHHSHRIQPIECYKDKYICYSLGNFCFAGNSKPSDMTSIIFQIQYRVKDGNISFRGFRVVPIRISSNKDRNDFIPTILEDGYTLDSVLNNTLKDKNNIRDLEYAVTDIPLEWDY